MLYNTSTWAILLGTGLTVLLLVIYLIVAAKKRAWRWLIALLVLPPLSFSCYAFFYVSDFDTAIAASFVFITLIGLPNLLFCIKVLKPTGGFKTLDSEPRPSL
jgi:hypothetical protein